jgi:hypothetical protein
MLGHCFRCGAYGEVGPMTTASGGSRILCTTCTQRGGGPAPSPIDASRLGELYGRYDAGRLLATEFAEFQSALEFVRDRALQRGDWDRFAKAEAVIQSISSKPSRRDGPGLGPQLSL